MFCGRLLGGGVDIRVYPEAKQQVESMGLCQQVACLLTCYVWDILEYGNGM